VSESVSHALVQVVYKGFQGEELRLKVVEGFRDLGSRQVEELVYTLLHVVQVY